jgi:hypothetical protein
MIAGYGAAKGSILINGTRLIHQSRVGKKTGYASEI